MCLLVVMVMPVPKGSWACFGKTRGDRKKNRGEGLAGYLNISQSWGTMWSLITTSKSPDH